MSNKHSGEDKQGNVKHRHRSDGEPLWFAVLVETISGLQSMKITPQLQGRSPHKGVREVLGSHTSIDSMRDTTRIPSTIPIDTSQYGPAVSYLEAC